jgi:hypothetical protein
MRYNYFAPLHEQHNNEDPFDLASCGGYCGIGTTFYFPNTKDFDPRVSFAYSPDVFRGNIVFRAGFGIYHGEIQLGDEDSPVVNTEPSTLLTSSASNVYSYPSALALIPTTGLAQTPRSLLRNHPDSYTVQWTGSVQQSLGQQSVLTFTYLGIKGNHLFRRTYTNLIDPVTGLRPLGSFFPSQIDTKANEGMSMFNALQANLTHRFHNGFFVAGNYMFSHASMTAPSARERPMLRRISLAFAAIMPGATSTSVIAAMRVSSTIFRSAVGGAFSTAANSPMPSLGDGR